MKSNNQSLRVEVMSNDCKNKSKILWSANRNMLQSVELENLSEHQFRTPKDVVDISFRRLMRHNKK